MIAAHGAVLEGWELYIKCSLGNMSEWNHFRYKTIDGNNNMKTDLEGRGVGVWTGYI